MYNIKIEDTPKQIHSLGAAFADKQPNGETLSFSNYFMEINGKPFYGICGEFHFARCRAEEWEDALIAMKTGGINVVATYIFWIHHEEEEGVFDFTGRRDLHRFVALCQKHGLYVIARIGPFDHGEVRNGGLPDWMYGKPYDVRSNNDGFFDATRRLYTEIHKQLDGMYYQQGGCVIAAQMDNEYMHSAAPWEQTTGVSNEWIPGGADGDAYMLRLLALAKEVGIDVPFYTCTGWGGAATPKELMPLWGGYAFRPWIFYSYAGEHPATEEYIYRDNHNNAVPATYNFEPFYKPEDKPYLCCEMGGGMTCCYYYRFQLPYQSVDAMANVKLASGCNMLGYYMYKGGTNPTGKRTPFLNEGQVPKLSYDYQAPLGEYGQVRESYHRLRTLHSMTQDFAELLCPMKTFLPDGSQELAPEDTATLRFAVRVNEVGQGFLFLNNYQDHAQMHDKNDESIEIVLPHTTVRFEHISLKAGENCVLPFHLQLCGIPMAQATAQYITYLSHGNDTTAFFFAPDGMEASYRFEEGVSLKAGLGVSVSGGTATVAQTTSRFTAQYGAAQLHIVTLSRAQANDFYKVDTAQGEIVLLTNANVLASNKSVRFESSNAQMTYDLYVPEREACWETHTLTTAPLTAQITAQQVGQSRYTIDVSSVPTDAKRALLQVDYFGDIGTAFLNGTMISDNFSNGAVWEIGLNEHWDLLKKHPVTLYLAPLREGSTVNVESVMAGRKEEGGERKAGLSDVNIRFVYEWEMPV